MAVAFSQKVRSARITRGMALGNIRLDKCSAASHITGIAAHGSPVDRAPNSSFTSGLTYPEPPVRVSYAIDMDSPSATALAGAPAFSKQDRMIGRTCSATQTVSRFLISFVHFFS